MSELLAPAGDFLCAKVALYNGCDAIYCATSRFGARAYAKNLSMDELKELLILAHSMKKKIYVTVNTILKENEMNDCIEYVKELYQLGVDAIIVADFAIITYVINNLPEMEAHISTQDGIKNIYDIKFFENLGAKRCVLARENTIEEIKEFKKQTTMPLEVFAHGALCVSYSGGCLMSSLLSLRSGNRGRCSQNCRREYTIYKDGKILAEKGYHLSMKDLNTSSYLDELTSIGVDSLKLEGRMKNPEYVKIVTSEYRKKLDDKTYNPKLLSTVFHRSYTKGFLFGEDRGLISDPKKKTNEGDFIGTVGNKVGEYTLVNITKSLSKGDRIRIELENQDDYYFTVDEILTTNKKQVNSLSGNMLLTIYKNMPIGANIYKMIDSTISLDIENTYKVPLTFTVTGKLGTPLKIETTLYGKTYSGTSTLALDQAKSRPLDNDTLIKQLSKLNDTSFYLKDVINNLEGDLFITVAEINTARRNLILSINHDMQNERAITSKESSDIIKFASANEIILTAFCVNEEQRQACIDSNIKVIYCSSNYSKYVNADFKDIDESYILAGNYGALNRYPDKEITTDYSFNVINSRACYELFKAGADHVTLSLETSYNDLVMLHEGFIDNYGFEPSLEMTVYGRENLMTMKYCPLKKYGQCGKCNDSAYYLEDEKGKFPIYHEPGCVTHLINDKPLSLIDDLVKITPMVKRLRLSFTTENYQETIDVINRFKARLNKENCQGFDTKNETRGYFKREIL